VRFFKSFDVIRLAHEIIEDYNAENGTSIHIHWANDPGNLMLASYPVKPKNWTRSLGKPEQDKAVPLAGHPNPVSSHPNLALLQVEGLEAGFNPNISMADTGVLLLNHATREHNQYFDPKVDDTVILNRNIKNLLLERHPELHADNILASWMGIKEENPNIRLSNRRTSQLERTRRMRGENLGHAYLYETAAELPDGDQGYRYWEALEALKNRGVKHIVVIFPQIVVDSVLNLVEVPNQIAKEIGFRNWLYIDNPDFETYPGVGHPFADYWGNWVDTVCPTSAEPERPCCFNMGGCGDGRPYPPARIAAGDAPRSDLDPSLAYDVSEFGHLGYDPAVGQPDPDRPVQSQYSGTWAMWQAPNDDPRVGAFLAERVAELVQASGIAH
jgi:hypothetical protein